MSILELCEKFFGTKDLYQLLGLKKDALPRDVKKAYYKLSLQVHPDRVPLNEKETATEKFKVLSKIYQVLSDDPKRALYDEQGIIDDEEDTEGKFTAWMDVWRKLFKSVTIDDIENYEKSYIGSELERTDIKKAYLSGKGCINHMTSHIPFMKVEDEPRIQQIVLEMIAAEEVPEFKIFTNEPKQKRMRRHKKYARESEEAAEIKKKMESRGSLEQQIIKRQSGRAAEFGSLMDRLMEKYGGQDDNSVDFQSPRKTSKKTPKGKPKPNSVKSGRVSKKKH